MALKQTPSQTVGPYFAYCLTPEQYGYPFRKIADGTVATPETDGARIRIEGCVFDGAGNKVPDAIVEIWQADAQGKYATPATFSASNSGFTGFGRMGTGTDPNNRFIFDTVKPGRIDDAQAPHIIVILMMRGLLVHAFTRIYFADEAAANAADPVLRSVEEGRRPTLVAVREGDIYRFDIRMQGPDETVFFDV